MKSLFIISVLLIMCTSCYAQVPNSGSYSSLSLCGPNPFVDIQCFGARAVNPGSAPAALGITAACVATNANVTISSASTFVNGDGVVLYGCGAASGMSTPSAPTVTASLAATPPGTGFAVNAPAGGSTTVCYKYTDRDKGQGLTVASAETCVTGQAPGQKTLSITSASISNNVLTYTTAARSPELLAVGMYFCLFSTTNDAIFAGCMTVATVPNNTTFTATTQNDTRAGIGNTTATGGTMTYWNMNHVVPPTAGTNVWEHIYYAGATGAETFDGIGLPVNPSISGDASYQVWDDLGSPYTTAPVNPGFIPTSPPASAVADSLVTTISSGAGTTTLTLSVAPTTSVASTPIRLEFGQNIKAAFTAAATSHGMVYIPESFGNSFVITALTDLNGFANQGVAVAGQLYLVDTLIVRGDWNGERIVGATTTPQFGYSGYTPLNISGAFPGISTIGGLFSGIAFVNGGNQYNSFYINGGNIATMRMEYCAFSGSSSSDYSGVNFIAFGNGQAGSNPAGLIFHNVQGNTNQGNSATPQFHLKNFGEVNFEGFLGSGRGFFFDQNGTGTFVDFNGQLEIQALSTPWFTAYAPASSISFNLQNIIEDTGVEPIIATLSGSVSARMYNVSSPSGGVPIVTGLPIGLVGMASPGTGSVNTNTSGDSGGIIYDGTFNATQSVHVQNTQFIVGPDFSLYTAAPQPPAPTCSVISAGPPFVPAGSYNFFYYPIYPNGSVGGTGRGIGSPASNTCVANGTSQQITVNLPGLLPGASTYLWTYGANFADINGVHCTNTTTALSWTFQGTNCGFGTAPAFPGSGPAGMSNGTVWGQTVQINATVFANLGTPTNGTVVFCSDCTTATSPCTGSGNGSLAVRQNGAWKCF